MEKERDGKQMEKLTDFACGIWENSKNEGARANETSKRLGNGKGREKWKTRVRRSESNLEKKQDLE